MAGLEKWLPQDVLDKFEVYNYNHAAEILTESFPNELNEIINALRSIKINIEDLKKAGGNESPIPPKFAEILEPQNWMEIKISGDLIVKLYPRKGKKKSVFDDKPFEIRTIEDFIDGHNIDFVKNRVALDIEWNSKDQTYDRDLFAMRTYYECGVVSVGVIITRSEDLNDVFRKVYALDSKTGKWSPIFPKYGASTTWMGKLIPRLDSRRHGGCPILAIGLRKICIDDWSNDYCDEHDPARHK